MILKKELLESLIKSNKVDSCTFIGKPTEEVITRLIKEKEDARTLLDKYEIRYTYYEDLINDVHEASVGIYMPQNNGEYIKDIFAVIIENPTLKHVEQMNHLFESIEEYYQADITLPVVDYIIGINNSPIDFSDMLSIIPAKSQTEIAEKVGKSKQLITDIKSGKSHVTFDLLKSLMNEYPLLPWDYFIKG